MIGIFGLSVVGGVFNLYTNSGLVNSACPNPTTGQPTTCNSQVFSLTCAPSGTNPSPICSNLASVGCQVNNASCTLQGNTGLSVLNPNSPFTTLLSGNLLGFAKSLFGTFNPITGLTLSGTPQYPWDTFGVNNSNYQRGFAYCNTPSNPNNVPVPATPKFVDIYQCNINSAIAGSYSYWVSNAGNGLGGLCLNVAVGCASQTNIEYALNVGLPVAPGTPASPQVNNTMYALGYNGALNPGVALSHNGQSGYLIFLSTILNNNHFNSTYQYQFKVFYVGQTSTTNGPNNIQTLTLVAFGFAIVIGGIIIIMLILGLSVGALTVSAAVNNQGTRLAQAAGISLLVWSVLYSEFSSWLSPAILPNGIDILLGLFLTGSIFCGIFIITLSGPSGSAGA